MFARLMTDSSRKNENIKISLKGVHSRKDASAESISSVLHKLENLRKSNLSVKCDSYLCIMMLNECICKDLK